MLRVLSVDVVNGHCASELTNGEGAYILIRVFEQFDFTCKFETKKAQESKSTQSGDGIVFFGEKASGERELNVLI